MKYRVVRRYLLAQLLPVKRDKVAINLDLDLPTLWYEDEDGHKWLPDLREPSLGPPMGFRYQHSRFPNSLTETVLRLISQEDVDACSHPEVIVDHGLIEGLEGRICRVCGGSQTKRMTDPWPSSWKGGGSKEAYQSTSSYPTELVLAMTRPTSEETLVAKGRGYTNQPVSFERAVILASSACERCLNVLLYRHGSNDGYQEGSSEWLRSNTRCLLCE